jgi:hypothetical protein
MRAEPRGACIVFCFDLGGVDLSLSARRTRSAAGVCGRTLASFTIASRELAAFATAANEVAADWFLPGLDLPGAGPGVVGACVVRAGLVAVVLGWGGEGIPTRRWLGAREFQVATREPKEILP